MRPLLGTENVTLGTLTSGSTDGTWIALPQAFSRHTVRGLFAAGSSSTVQLRGAMSSDSTATGIVVLATIDNSTQIAWNSTAVPVTWIEARATAISSGTIAVTYAGTVA
mgnify:FL=1